MIQAVPVGSLPSSAGFAWYHKPTARLSMTGIEVAMERRTTDHLSKDLDRILAFEGIRGAVVQMLVDPVIPQKFWSTLVPPPVRIVETL